MSLAYFRTRNGADQDDHLSSQRDIYGIQNAGASRNTDADRGLRRLSALESHSPIALLPTLTGYTRRRSELLRGTPHAATCAVHATSGTGLNGQLSTLIVGAPAAARSSEPGAVVALIGAPPPGRGRRVGVIPGMLIRRVMRGSRHRGGSIVAARRRALAQKRWRDPLRGLWGPLVPTRRLGLAGPLW